MGLVFREISAVDFERTLERWKAEADEADMFPDEVETKLSWISKAIGGAVDPVFQQMAYGVFQEGESIATAVCDVVLSQKGTKADKWLKLLKVQLSPQIEAKMQENDPTAINLAVASYREAVLGTFSAQKEHDIDTLKLYGRNGEILRFLVVLVAMINADPRNNQFTARQEGRWVVIRLK